MTKAPYITDNMALALALHLAGAEIRKVTNTYTPELLSRLGFKTIEQAVAKGSLGKVSFEIAPHERLEQIIAAYDAEAMATGDTETEGDISPEDAARIAARYAKTRRDLAKLMNDPRAAWLYVSNGPVDTQSIEEKMKQAMQTGQEFTQSFPGGKLIRHGAPESTKRKLGL